MPAPKVKLNLYQRGLMKIKINVILLIAAISVTLVSCGGYDPTNDKSPETSDITAAIITNGDFEELTDIQSDRLGWFYNISESLLESYSVMVCLSGGSADEVVVMKAASADNAELIKTAVSERKAERMHAFYEYRPEEYKKLTDSVVKSIGPYVLFVVSGDTDSAVRIFNGFFEK